MHVCNLPCKSGLSFIAQVGSKSYSTVNVPLVPGSSVTNSVRCGGIPVGRCLQFKWNQRTVAEEGNVPGFPNERIVDPATGVGRRRVAKPDALCAKRCIWDKDVSKVACLKGDIDAASINHPAPGSRGVAYVLPPLKSQISSSKVEVITSVSQLHLAQGATSWEVHTSLSRWGRDSYLSC